MQKRKCRFHVRVAVTVFSVCAAALMAGCDWSPGQPYFEKGVAALEHGEFKLALKKLSTAVYWMKDDPAVWANYGAALYHRGQMRECIGAFSQVTNLSVTTAISLEYIGRANAHLTKWEEARSALAAANSMQPGSPRILTAMGVVEYHAKSNAAAGAFFSKALAVDPNYPPALYNTARLYLGRTGNRADGLKYFQKYSLVSGTDEAHLRVATAEIEGANESGLVRERPPSESPRKERPGDPLIKAAMAAVEKEDYDEALELLKDAVKKDVTNPDALWELAVLYEKNVHAPDKAAKTYARFRQQFPTDPRCGGRLAPKPDVVKGESWKAEINAKAARNAFDQGLKRYAAKDWDGAIAGYSKALELSPDWVDATYNIGLAYKEKGLLDKAADSFTRALKIRPDMLEASYMLAVVFRARKQHSQAIEQLNRILKVEPDYAEAHRLMGLVYLDINRGDLARRRFERYLQLEPEGAAARQVKDWLEKTRN